MVRTPEDICFWYKKKHAGLDFPALHATFSAGYIAKAAPVPAYMPGKG